MRGKLWGIYNSLVEIIVYSIMSAGVSAGLSALMAGMSISGFNAGRGSLKQVTTQINTKLLNGKISRISFTTFAKVLTYNLAYSSLGVLVGGYLDSSYIMSNRRHQKKIPTGIVRVITLYD